MTILDYKIGLLCIASLVIACGDDDSSAPTMTSIAVAPDEVTIAAGLTLQFTATGVFDDGSEQDVTADVAWTSADAAVTIDASGLVTTSVPGETTITATLDDVIGSATLVVSNAALVSIGITPAAAEIPHGVAQAFTATGVYTDSSTADLTADVTWTSSDMTIATISSDGGADGVITTLTVGTTSITATYEGTVSPSASLTVRPAEVASLTVEPATASVPKGVPQSFTVTGTFTDGTTQDLTSTVLWTSSDIAIASISNDVGTHGEASTLAEGTIDITASLAGVSSPVATLEVTPPELVSISVTPPGTTQIPLGTSQQFAAEGELTDGSKRDLTAEVTWSSSDVAVASIDTAGLASSLDEGNTAITAQLGAVVSGAVTLTVAPPALVSLSISPIDATVLLSGTKQFKATGNFTDGSIQDVTTTVTWSSSDGAIAQISNADGSRGLSQSVAFGTTTISATAGAVVQSTALTVADNAWTLAPAAPISLFGAIPLLPDASGRVLVVNHDTPDNVAFDPTGGQWTPLAPRPTSFVGVEATVSGGRVVVSGGVDPECIFCVGEASTHVYDVSTNLWSTGGNMTVGRFFHAVVTLDDERVLAFSGQGNEPFADLYDPATGNWSATGNMILGLQNPRVTRLLDGRVLAAGGTLAGVQTPSTNIYDPDTGTWTTVAPMLRARREHVAALLPDGRVLVAAGIGPFNPTGLSVLSHAEIYNPATNTWTQVASMKIPRMNAAATVLADGRVLVSGGLTGNNNTVLRATEIYDPIANTWTLVSPMEVARHHHAIATLPDGGVVVVGGECAACDSAEVWRQ